MHNIIDFYLKNNKNFTIVTSIWKWRYELFILDDGCVREDALTKNLKTRLENENHTTIKTQIY